MKVKLVVALLEENLGIGYQGKLPWRLPKEMRYFKEVTTTVSSPEAKNVVIMGRKTYESIPEKYRPLEDRINVVISRQESSKLGFGPKVLVYSDLREALDALNSHLLEEKENPVGAVFSGCRLENCFLIGGASLYHQALHQKMVDELYVTKIKSLPKETKIDSYFPLTSFSDYILVSESKPVFEKDAEYVFTRYLSKESQCLNKEEMQYLDLVKECIERGSIRDDRTKVGTLSVFGKTMRFDLTNGFPLLTTKRTFFRGVVEELLFFIKGDTNNKNLQSKNIHIWDGNASRQFLDKLGLTQREEGDLGPVYGFQWRHFGAEYIDCNSSYEGKGVDQLADVINTLKNNPTSRRIILSAWNPADLKKMVLPPCHMFAQFYADPVKKELSCSMYQRSADMGLGVPFNIASYALLTILIAQCTGLQAKEFVHVIGDCHVYSNHVDALQKQLKRVPRKFPKLKVNNPTTHIEGFKYDDFELVGYKPYGKIKMDMAV
eukprot:maker-scaffold_1-snap-gene-18.41-mRNA-1 protein AED:0.02 eAED:0.02 QI:203/1/1/1/1/1/2/29/490